MLASDGLDRLGKHLDLEPARVQHDRGHAAAELAGAQLLRERLDTGAHRGAALLRQLRLHVEPAALQGVHRVGARLELGQPGRAVCPRANLAHRLSTLPGFISPSGSIASLMRRIIAIVSASCSTWRKCALP